MTSYRLKTEHHRQQALEDLRTVSLPARMELHEGDDRSLEQNRLSWVLYGRIGKHHGLTPEEAHRLCKLRYGVPILRRDSEDFDETYRRVIEPLDYRDQLRAMSLFDVSSVMTVAQMTEYLDTIQRERAEAA